MTSQMFALSNNLQNLYHFVYQLSCQYLVDEVPLEQKFQFPRLTLDEYKISPSLNKMFSLNLIVKVNLAPTILNA